MLFGVVDLVSPKIFNVDRVEIAASEGAIL